ncbi:toxin glutamine deamidase domain-containing protein [Streptomyces sp. NRRL B-24484]|uniref:toxin glutamine deamidase domain-containing protein n=1 Tax=Streptomyces sp. NRRL B-24484 TaxID=1463833 RepID=UPI0004C1A71B|nr:toxin glutamine deamidase domain-containing protein [Streptomyces sp. NRRL B-24484]
MPRNLPEELAPVMARLGRHWPEADEDALRRAAGLWREFGAEAERLGRRGGSAAERVTGENSGPAVEAFADHWRGFSGGGRGHLDDAHGAAESLAGAFDKAAAAVDDCKAQLVAVLTDLAEEIAQADKAEAAAAAQVKAAQAEGVSGLVGQVVGTVKGVAAEAGEAIAVETAKIKVGALLAELGREMKDRLQAALKEPAVTALERMAQADGAGKHGQFRTLSAARSGGGITGELLGTAVGGATAVAGVRGVSAALNPDGTVATDAQGRPVLVGADGKRVPAVDGVSVQVGADGKPVLGDDGRPVLLDAAGAPVAGLALGADGKPLTDAQGKPLTVGADGAVGDTGLSLAVGKDGRPVLDEHGRPVMVDAEGNPAAGLAVGKDGKLLTDPDGRPLVAGVGRDGRPLVDAAVGPDGVRLGADGLPVAAADLGTGPGRHGAPGTTGDPDGLGGLGGLGDRSADGPAGTTRSGPGRTAPVLDVDLQAAPAAGVQVTAAPQQAVQTPLADGGGHRAASGGGGPSGGWAGPSGGHQAPAAPAYEPDGYDLPPAGPRPGPISVHTDSVAVAPPSPQTYGPPAEVPTGGRHGGDFAVPAAPASPAAGSGFPLGPVGGGPAAGAGPVASTPAPPVAGPVGGAAGGAAAAPGAAGTPAAGAPGAGAPGAPGTAAPGAAGPGAAGQPGAQGGSSGVVGAVVGTPGAVPRTPAGGPAAGAPGTGTPGAGGTAPLPFRPGESGDLRRRPELLGLEQHTGPTVVPVLHPGQVAAAYLAARAGRSGQEAPAVPVPVRGIADGRPYGLPGGLGPVDPAHQAEVERLVPRRPDGTPELHPDPAGGWTEALNGGGPREPGRANNTVDVALSSVDTFSGLPVCSAPRLPDGPAGEYGGRDRAERELGREFHDTGAGEGALARVAETLLRSGPGAQAVLLTLDGFRRPHVWNVVNHGERLTWLDHQTGRSGREPLYDAEHGLWAIALDAECRPLDIVPPAAVKADAGAATAEDPAGPGAAPVAAAPAEPAPEPAAEPARPAEPAPPRSRLHIHRTAAGSARR